MPRSRGLYSEDDLVKSRAPMRSEPDSNRYVSSPRSSFESRPASRLSMTPGPGIGSGVEDWAGSLRSADGRNGLFYER